MAEAKAKEVEVADYYQCTGGFTVGVYTCSDGEVVEGSTMGFSETNPPLDEEQQVKQYGRVMYKEYEPDEDEVEPIAKESRTIRAMMGMQTPDMPPVDPIELSAVPLDTLSRQELRAKAKSMGLNFPADTDRDQMIGAIEKKQKEGPEKGDEPEVVSKRRAAAKEAIESNNALATGGSGGGGGSTSSSQQAPEEEEAPSA